MGAATAAPRALRLPDGLRGLAAVVVCLAIIAVSLSVAIALPAAPFALLLTPVFGATCIWMFVSARYEWSLAVLLLYLALVDGFVRLTTGIPELTLLRDGLLYAIVLAAALRALVGRRPLGMPPLGSWVVAYVAVVLVQLTNPAAGSLTHTVASLRPHLEWVPLFFLAYLVMRNARRLRIFFLLLLLVATANGFVNVVQLNLSVDQFASWGPGYHDLIHGTGALSGRSYAVVTDPNTGATVGRNRSFGLGSDIGFGGAIGMLALPGGIALTMLGRRRGRPSLVYAGLTGGAVFAVLTSAQRTSVVSAVVAVRAFALVASFGRRRLLLGLVAVALVTVPIALALAAGSSGAFTRYSDITPGRVLSTAFQHKGGTLGLVPTYVADFPLGAGIGSVGPAVSLTGGPRAGQPLNSDSEPTYLLIELGVAGFLVLLGFGIRLLVGAWRRVRRLADYELRLLLGALVAAFAALLFSGLSGAATSNTPGGPFFWFAAGTVAFWLFQPRPSAPAGTTVSRLRPVAPPLPLPPGPSATVATPTAAATRFRVVCGPRRLEVDGIRDYADRLASSLAAMGLEVEVDDAKPDARPADVVLVNYNPFSWSRWGFAPGLAASLSRARRDGSLVYVVVHESYVPPLSWRWAAMGAWQRRQLRMVHRAADLVFTPVEPLAEELRHLDPPRPVVHLPVGSNLPDMRHARDSERARLEIGEDELVIAAFGTGHPSRRIGDVAVAANVAADLHGKVVVLNLGAGAPPVRVVRASVRVIEPGFLDSASAARHLAAADLFLAPFVDGVSARRTTLMAALQHGLPVIGTDGRLTDHVLRDARQALTLVPVGDRKRLAEAVRWLIRDREERLARGAAGRELYERHFDWPVIAAAVADPLP